ncbi:retention module-containing protein, partial [Enterovibrio coralii]|uniref:retention module-containing protein n=1 Tax=Enterovibrio coralii TaxID=294935 RepID=UPI000A5B165E
MDSIITQQAAKVVSVNGNVHVQVNGEIVTLDKLMDILPGTEIFLPEGAGALLTLEDGSLLTIGEGVDPDADEDAEGDEISLEQEIADIQSLIEEGVDPTAVLESTAAGTPSLINSGSQGLDSVDRDGNETISDAGFQTQGYSRSFSVNNESQHNTSPGLAPTLFATTQADDQGDDGDDDNDNESMTFTLSSSTDGQTLAEGSSVTYTVTLDGPANEDLTVTLSNGLSITIAEGASSGSATSDVREDDAYAQGNENASVSITGVSDNDYDEVSFVGVVTNTISDDRDATKVTLELNNSIGSMTEGDTVDLTVSVESAPQNSDLVITLSNGQLVTIPKGQTSVTVDFTPDRGDDTYTQGQTSQTVSVTGVSGGDYEDVDISGASATVNITDDSDATKVSLELNKTSATEGEVLDLTVNVESAPQNSDLLITLSNGQTVTIPQGQTSVTVDFTPDRADDAYTQGQTSQIVSVTSTSGGGFENLNSAEATASVDITDDNDTTTFTLSSTTDGEDVVEGGSITYAVTLDAAAKEDITVTLSNGKTVTILEGELSGTVEVDVRADDVYERADDTVSATITGVSANSFESVKTTGTVTNKVVDDKDTTTFTLSSTTNGEDVVEGGSITYTVTLDAAAKEDITVTLSNGKTVTILEGELSGNVEVNVRADDVYEQADDTVS